MYFNQNSRAYRRLKWPTLAVLVIMAIVTTTLLSSSAGMNHAQPRRFRYLRSTHTRALRRPIALTVEPTHATVQFTPGAIGLSIETSTLSSDYLSTDRRSLVRLMRLLGPSVLRVGGNTTDSSWWASTAEPAPAWSTNTITPKDLARLRELLEAANWRAILAVDFGHFSPERAANEAGIAANILGSRLLGIEIGNEPNGYRTPSVGLRNGTYNVTSYLDELAAYSTAIRNASPSIPLYGPDLSAPNSWLKPIAEDPQIPFNVLTEHYYPTAYNTPKPGCEASAIPTAADLLSPQVRQDENAILEALVAAGQLQHRPTRLSETNTTASCDESGGPDTGPVFASALWSLDWSLRAASAGVEGLNFHGTFGPCSPVSFSPLCASGSSPSHPAVLVRPEYYGLLAARQLKGGRFIPISIKEQSIASNLAAYATIHSSGTITVAIDNFASQGPAFLALRARGYAEAIGKFLTARSADSTAGVSFGRSSFNGAGKLRTRGVRLARVAGGMFSFSLPPTSAVIVTLAR